MRFRFFWQKVFFLACFAALSTALYFFIKEPDPHSLEKILSGQAKKPQKEHQMRMGVSKEIFFKDKKLAVHAKKSELVFKQGVIERLFGVNGSYAIADKTFEFQAPEMDWSYGLQIFSAKFPRCRQGEFSLEADRIEWDHKKGQLAMEKPCLQEGKRLIAADRGSYELQSQQVRFEGELFVYDADLGEAKAFGNCFCQLENDQLRYLEGEGALRIESLAGLTIENDGPWRLDLFLGEIVLKKGEKQVLVEDEKGEARSNFAKYFFKEDAGKFHVEKVFLEGDVMVQSFFGVQKSSSQYLLADRGIYQLASNQMVFEADPGQRVLYYDRLNNFKLSAPKIQASLEKGGVVKGVGNVRFDLAREEWEQVKKRFSLK